MTLSHLYGVIMRFGMFHASAGASRAETRDQVAGSSAVQAIKVLGLLPITAPDSARGKLDTTYLDEELRVSRGDRGNLFVLERYEDLPQ